jgi:hypothetical protein
MTAPCHKIMSANNDSPESRPVYIVSDGTGITAEALARSVLSQFDVEFRKIRLPFIDNAEKAREARERIDADNKGEKRPIVFSTLVKPELAAILRQANALHLDLIQTFAEPLSKELGMLSTHEIGRSHQSPQSSGYKNRIDAINFTIEHDDGQSHRNLAAADVILIGVSRSGKTPTSLYLALQQGIKVANYPLIPEDFERNALPSALLPFKGKLFGLSISPERLSEIRNERLPNSYYASLENCRHEVAQAEAMMRREEIPWLSSTTKSIEEISTAILHEIGLDQRE